MPIRIWPLFPFIRRIILGTSPLIVMWPCQPLQKLPFWRLLPSHSRRALNSTSFCRSSLMWHCLLTVLISANYPLCLHLFYFIFPFLLCQTIFLFDFLQSSHRCRRIISKQCKVENELLMSYEGLNIFWQTCCCIEFIFIIVPLLEAY